MVILSSFPDGKNIDIPLYETDSMDSFLARMKLSIDPVFPSLVMTPTSFPKSVSDLSDDRPPPRFVSLHTLLSPIKNVDDLPGIFHELKKEGFDIDLYRFLETWLFLALPVHTEEQQQRRWSVNLFSLKSTWTTTLLDRFGESLVIPGTTRVLHREEFKKRLDMEWYNEKRNDMEYTKDSVEKQVQTADEIARTFAQLEPLPITDTVEKGRIMTFEVHDIDLSTGQLFETCILSHDYPCCHYKTFYRKFYDDSGNIGAPSSLTSDPPDLVHFYGLQIYDGEGRTVIFVMNKAYGIWVQCMIGVGALSMEDVFRILGVGAVDAVKRKSTGVMIEFRIENPSPLKKEWNPLDPSIFSDMCMNNPIMQNYLSTNDTDKISRSNQSMFLYYFDRTSVHKKEEEDEKNYIDGWNRSNSRFGDLTAIVHTERVDDRYFIVIRITRSRNEEIMDRFKYFFSRFVRLYNEEFEDELNMFKKYVPGFRLAPVSIEKSTKAEDEFRLFETIFPSNVYSTVCQKKVKPTVVEEDDLQKLDDSQWIAFPTPEMKSDFPLRYYACLNKKGGYIHPGFVDIKKDDHPFGFAPCCFKEDHKTKNAARIREYIEKGRKTDIDTEEPLSFMKLKYKIASEKRIDNTGQLGVIPDSLQAMLITLIEPFGVFYRVGLPSKWSSFSVIACLEYYDAITRRRSETMRRPTEIRKDMLRKIRPDVMKQECYDWSLEEIRSRIGDMSQFIDPRRFWRLLEIYFRVNLVIFAKDVKNEIQIIRPRSFGNYYYYSFSNRPVVCLYQHLGGTRMMTESMLEAKDPYYELLVYQDIRDQTNQFRFDVDMNPLIEAFFSRMHAGYEGDHWIRPSIPLSSSKLVFTDIHIQYIDCTGKTSAFIYKNKSVFVCEHDRLPPFNTSSGIIQIISMVFVEHIYDWIRDMKIVRAEFYNGVCSILVNDMIDLRLVWLQDHSVFEVQWKECFPTIPIQQTDRLPHSIYPFMRTEPLIHRYNTIQILVDVVQDYLLHFLAQFIRISDVKNLIEKQAVEEVIESFFTVYVKWLDDELIPYKDVDRLRLSSMVRRNRNLFHRDKLILPKSAKDRFRFFLMWYLLNNEQSLEFLHDITELPSFYQNASSFLVPRDNTVQLTTDNVPWPSGTTPYQTGPISELVENAPPLFYYYNEEETPFCSDPMVVQRFVSMEDAEKRLKRVFEGKNDVSYYSWDWETGKWVGDGRSSQCAIVRLEGFTDEDTIILLFIPFPRLYSQL